MELTHTAGGDGKRCNHFGEQFGSVINTLNVSHPVKHSSVGICSGEKKADLDTNTVMFVGALFMTALNWKQP